MQRFLINLLLLLTVLAVLFFFSPLSRMFDYQPPASEVEIILDPEPVSTEEPATETAPEGNNAPDEIEGLETLDEEEPSAP